MGDGGEVFVGIDVAKSRNAVAIADGGRGGEVRYIGEVEASDESMRAWSGALQPSMVVRTFATRPDQPAIICIGSSLTWASPARWWHPRSSHGSPASG